MGWFRRRRSNQTPASEIINLRNLVDDSGHLLIFALEVDVADAAAGQIQTFFRYEDERHRLIAVSGPIMNLADTSADLSASGFQSHPMTLCLDKYFADNSGAFGEARGKFEFEFILAGSAGTSTFNYTILLTSPSELPYIDV